MAAPMSFHHLGKTPLQFIRSSCIKSINHSQNHTGVFDNPLSSSKTRHINIHRLTGLRINGIRNVYSNRISRTSSCTVCNCTPDSNRPNSLTSSSTSYRSTSASSAFISRKLGVNCLIAVHKRALQPESPNFLLGICRNYCSVTRTCWNCNTLTKLSDNSDAQFFCDACNAIQPVNPESNFFQTMQCERTFDINTAKLTQTFRNLQRKLHPDKFSIKSKEEQDYSAMQSSEVNKAYSTLLKPLSRGLYLLELNGLTIEEGDAGIEPEFLMEVMETNEELAETRDEATVRRIGEENAVKLEAFLKDLSQAFSRENYRQAREILMRLKYFANIDDKVKERLETSF